VAQASEGLTSRNGFIVTGCISKWLGMRACWRHHLLPSLSTSIVCARFCARHFWNI